MLDQLVESKSNLKEGTRRGKFLLTTFALVSIVFLNGLLWSLFAKDLGIGSENLELSTLISPMAIDSDVPPAPEPVKVEKQEQIQKPETLTTRQSNMERVDEAHTIPDVLSTTPNTQKARPNGNFVISNGPEVDKTAAFGNRDRGNGNNEGVSNISAHSQDNNSDTEDPPPVKRKTTPESTAKPPVKSTTISKGVINGSAVTLPKPLYPAAAKAIHAGGDVNVQVTIDENGNVISANAVSGHPLLKQVSETAAHSAKFKPTLLSGQPVKVTGLIVYKFITQ